MKLDDAAANYVLNVVNEYIKEIKSMEEKISLDLFKEFFQHSSPAECVKELLNTKNADENKKNEEEIKNRISDLEGEMKNMSDKEKEEQNADETLKILEKILYYNKDVQNFFHRSSKVDKKKSGPKFKKILKRG